ncbi:MAG TPA: potassium-transporting ATPase subunit C [Thermoplasmata archaeon]|jgi:potassium-transporting ATPase potassium-binding subunit|nr:MAG TPA: potassium-transporting ATPase subunit C [Thermoplasmata archaeon]
MVNILKKYIGPAIIITLAFALITGLFYPALVTGVAQVVFPHQANGSPLVHNEIIVGSELIGQNFTQEKYFHGRPSAAGTGYDAMQSGGSNLGPSNSKLHQRIKASINESDLEGSINKDGSVAVDAVTASGSGLDPHITIANALAQIPRVARARNLSEDDVRSLVSHYVEGRDLGILGEPRINVLKLNLALDNNESSAPVNADTFDHGNPQVFGILQTAFIFGIVVILSYVIGMFLFTIVTGRQTTLSKKLKKTETWLFRILHVDSQEDMNWKTYALCVLAFSLISFLFTYFLLRLQGFLPFNPQGLASVPADVALSTAVSFGTNTNWQVYSGEQTMSYLSQMLPLAFQNFISTAVGMAVAVALIRAITKRKKDKGLGNFWVDITRIVLYILIPICIIAALFFVSQGVPQTFNGPIQVTTLEGGHQVIPVGPVASQEAIKELGTNGGGFFNANSAHPFENPNPVTNAVQIILLMLLPLSFLIMFGLMARQLKQGVVLFIVVLIFLVAAIAVTTYEEQGGNRSLNLLGVDQLPSGLQAGGNMEGKEVRFGIYGSTTFAVATTGVACGAVNSMHDSYTPLGGMIPMVLILLGEVVPGGAGAGFFSLFMYIIITIFIAGLMVGRIPNYLGKKIESFDMKMTVLILITIETTILVFAALSVVTPAGTSSITNPGPHGLSQILYAFGSGVGNNGSALAGLNAATLWYILTMTIAMFIGRFFIIIPMLAIAGSFAEKHVYQPTAGTLPTDNATFGAILSGVIVIVAGLSFLPILVLGPILEHLLLSGGHLLLFGGLLL